MFANSITFQLSSTRLVIASTGSSRNSSYFCQSTMEKSEMENGCKFGIDSWADTSC